VNSHATEDCKSLHEVLVVLRKQLSRAKRVRGSNK
jgi:hypothetical protein